MKNLFKLVGLIVCVALLAGCAGATEAPATPAPTEEPAVAPEALTASYADPLSGMTIQYPEGWTPVSNTGSVGITALSADWTEVTAFTLVYDNPKTLAEELTAAQDALTAGSAGFTNAAITGTAKITVFGTEYDAFTWTGYNAMASKDYTGIDAVAPYGTDVIHISIYAPVDTWEQAEPTLLAIVNSLVAPAADYAYVPPVQTTDWASFTSADYGLTVSYPPDWQAPTAPWVGEGLWLNSADWMTSVVVWVKDGTDAVQALADWETTQDIFPTLTVTDGDPVTVMGSEYPSKLGEGFNGMGTAINCGVTFVPYNGKLLEILWYAGTDGDYWTNGQTVFPGILSSLQGVGSFTSDIYNLTVSYPSSWQTPIDPWIGQGIWLNSADWMTSVVIWVEDGTDPAQMLADWESTQDIFPSLTVTDGEPVTIMGNEYATKMGEGTNSMGTAIKCGVTFVPYNGKMLKIVWYVGTDGGYWDSAEAAFSLILTSINIP